MSATKLAIGNVPLVSGVGAGGCRAWCQVSGRVGCRAWCRVGCRHTSLHDIWTTFGEAKFGRPLGDFSVARALMFDAVEPPAEQFFVVDPERFVDELATRNDIARTKCVDGCT